MTSSPANGLDQSASSSSSTWRSTNRHPKSSLSEWSQPHEAGNAVSGRMPADFVFHTAKEQGPWWRVDLGDEYPLEAIVVSNRLGVLPERASSLRIEVSVDGLIWTTWHSGLSVFGSARTGDPFVLWLRGAAIARHIRLSLDKEEALHLAQVEVFIKGETPAYLDYCRAGGLRGFYAKNANLHRQTESGGEITVGSPPFRARAISSR